jgi:hypothetical protein
MHHSLSKILLGVLLIPALVSDRAAYAQQSFTAGQKEALAVDHKVMAEVKHNPEIMANLTHLCDEIGARLTGSAALQRANEWAAAKMRSYGLTDVHQEPWTIPAGWERGPASAHIIEPPGNDEPLSLAAMGWTAGTKGKVTGDVVILKGGNLNSLKAYKGKLKDAIVLLGQPAKVGPVADADFGFSIISPPPASKKPRTAGTGFQAMFALMMLMGPQGQDFFRNEGVAAVLIDAGKPYGLLSTMGAWRGQDRATAVGAIPLADMAHEHFALLYRLASRPAPARTRVEIDIQNKTVPGPITVYNTVGEIRGSDKPDEYVVVGAHLDSWDLAQGATDNGTGSCVVLETARVLAKYGVRPRRTIRFVLFSGEEQGLYGSRAFVQQHKAEMPRTSLCLVHDTGTGRVVAIGTQGRKPLQPILQSELASLKEVGLSEINNSALMGSDHQSFEAAGVPGLALQQDMTEYFLAHHSQYDTVDKAREPDLLQGVQVMAVTALRVANLPALLPREKK